MTKTEIVRPLFLTRACREMTQPQEHDLTTVQISSCRLQKQENPISDASHTSFLNYFMGYDGCKYITRMLGYKFMRLPYGRKQARLEDKNSGRPRQPACSPFLSDLGDYEAGKIYEYGIDQSQKPDSSIHRFDKHNCKSNPQVDCLRSKNVLIPLKLVVILITILNDSSVDSGCVRRHITASTIILNLRISSLSQFFCSDDRRYHQ